MTLVYCTNIWSHHQGCVCEELAKRLGDNFKMVLFQPLDCDWSKERINMGWNLTPPRKSWIVGPPMSVFELQSGDYHRYIFDSDVAVIGISPYMDMTAIRRRIASRKLTFIMGERYFKDRRTVLDYINPRQWKRWIGLHCLLNHSNVHYLTMNHWCLDDLRFLHVCRNRIWRWAYQTPVSKDYPTQRDNGVVRIGWCGRMFDWKQPNLLIEAFAQLSCDVKAKCRLEIIGSGEKEEELHSLIDKYSLSGRVVFKPMLPHGKVIEWLREIDIYVLTSNRKEGWGAILIEAMDCGCAVVANREAGATLEVVEHGVNGFVFKDCDANQIAMQLEELIANDEKRRSFGTMAWKTVQKLSPAVGAENLIHLCTGILKNKTCDCPKTGLCSKRN